MQPIQRLALWAIALLVAAGAAPAPAQLGGVQPAPSAEAPAARATGPLAAAVNDREYYPAVLSLIENAQKTIDICLYQVVFYEEYPDSASNNLVDALADAARRGVIVTAVIDVSPWRGDHDEKNMDVGRRLAEAGAAVYLDDPDVQSHQKLAIFDRDVVVVASTNWSHFSLTHNREAGVVLWSRQAGLKYGQYFAERVAEAVPYLPEVTAAQPLMADHLAPALMGLPSHPVDDVLKLNNRWFFPKAAAAIRNAQESIDIVQVYAYYYDGSHRRAAQIPGRPSNKPPETDLLAAELIRAHERGIRVRFLMDHTWNEDRRLPWNASKLAFAQRLADAGIEVYRNDPREGMHAKMMLIDEDRVVVGSTNWSFEALEMNNEANVLVHSGELVREVYRPWVDDHFARASLFEGPLPEEAAGRR